MASSDFWKNVFTFNLHYSSHAVKHLSSSTRNYDVTLCNREFGVENCEAHFFKKSPRKLSRDSRKMSFFILCQIRRAGEREPESQKRGLKFIQVNEKQWNEGACSIQRTARPSCRLPPELQSLRGETLRMQSLASLPELHPPRCR